MADLFSGHIFRSGILCVPALLVAAGCGGREDLNSEFRPFLDTYVREIHERDREYLRNVHPELPEEMSDFFLDVTLSMMRYAEENGLEPTIECEEYDVCQVTWPQPGGNWAAQRFIRQEGAWQFLPEAVLGRGTNGTD